MKALLFLLSVWGVLGLVQCHSDVAEPQPESKTTEACDDPRAQPLIDGLLRSSKANPAGEVWRYSWQGRTVFLVNSFKPDAYVTLYDVNDNQLRYLGAPSGGITGKGDGKCLRFRAEATAGCLLWRDQR